MSDKTCNQEGAFKALYDTVVRLRAPDGCPWDREQTPASLRGDLIEETYECVEAIDEKDPAHIREELGDLYLLATMLSYMHEQEGHFSVEDTLRGVTEKLIRRHPHVFGEPEERAEPLSPAEVLKNWGKIKVEQEGRKPKDGLLDGVSRSLPPLDRAYKLQKQAAKAGFDWPDIKGVMDKLEEELGETCDAIGALEAMSGYAAEAPEGLKRRQEALEEELGDLLFSVINLCRFLKVDPSVALQGANAKFVRRFSHVEKRMRETGQEMNAAGLRSMDTFWEEAKA
ncbi:MAG: nucleoside triphosphate pyrophosphohydrolase [Treponema sp.]|jgi:tetrapyrrole methylase family protein/MazG family protein|nr:nucleoside triphosphate pyrophosphohydrolase [Treponema sp.]